LSELPIAITLCAALVTVLGFALGGIAVLVGVIASLLFLAWRYDNSVGACLPITVLVLITCAVLALLMYLMAIAIK
jgi:hypothetical protein